MLKRLLTIALFFLFFSCSTNAFVFGLKSADNSVENIVKIEKMYHLFLPIVGFIYDPWEQQDVVSELKTMKEQLGDQRIYHISVSPNQFSASEVANGAFDNQYKLFFQTIKYLNLKVIFRTMHEMNGGRYPWGSNPEDFKKAWIHVWELSRSLGLNQNDILFDFSFNHRDMPTYGKPSQKAQLIQCKDLDPLKQKVKKLKSKKNLTLDEKKNLKKQEEEFNKLKKCPRFEDYFPGPEYVDIVGMTFYNRGKATSNRIWLSPYNILNHPDWNTLQRAKKLGKPLFIDEVGTTAVRYKERYSPENSRKEFKGSGSDTRKNQWLTELSQLLQENEFIGALYFNVDYTKGLQFPLIGEADWAIINPELNKFYDSFWDLYSASQSDFSHLLQLFGLTIAKVNEKNMFVPIALEETLVTIETIINKHFSGKKEERSIFYQKLLDYPSGSRSFDEAIKMLNKGYVIK